MTSAAKREALTDEEKDNIARKICIAGGAMMMAVTMVVPTRAPMVLNIYKGNASQTARTMGLMTSVAGAIELFLNPVLGKLSDKYGRKPLLLLAPTVNGFLHTLVAAFPNVLAMQFVDRMITGMFIFGFMSPARAALTDLFAKDMKKLGVTLASFGTYFGIGCTVGPFIGSRMGGARSFLASALSFLGTFLWVSTQVNETLPVDDRKREVVLSDVNPVAFLKLFRERVLSWLTVTKALQSFGDYVNMYDINNLFMISVLGYGQSQIGNFATTVGFTQILGGRVTGAVIKATSLKTATLFSNLMWILGMAMMGTAKNTRQAFLALFVWTFGHGRATPVDPYLQKYGGAQGYGRGDILGADGNLQAYVKVLVPVLYSNLFAWATTNGRNMPGLPYFTICLLTSLSQLSFWKAGPED